MDSETRKRLKSFAKLLCLLVLLVVGGYWVVSRVGQVSHAHFKGSAVPQYNHEGRFRQVDVFPAELKGDLALDSNTGQLCKTWKWSSQTPPGAAHARYEGIPLCSSLADPGSGGSAAQNTRE
jgi:hypothetical protein